MGGWKRFLENPAGWFVFQFVQFAIMIYLVNTLLLGWLIRGVSWPVGVALLVVELGLLFVFNLRLRRRLFGK
jgi:hypothetical protein